MSTYLGIVDIKIWHSIKAVVIEVVQLYSKYNSLIRYLAYKIIDWCTYVTSRQKDSIIYYLVYNFLSSHYYVGNNTFILPIKQFEAIFRILNLFFAKKTKKLLIVCSMNLTILERILLYNSKNSILKKVLS